MKIRSQRLAYAAGVVVGLLLRLIFATLRLRVRLAQPRTSPYDRRVSRRFLYSVWHDQLLFGTFARRSPFAATLVSRHRDGSFLCGALSVMKLTLVRGSSKRGGTRALREAMALTRDRHVAISPDGPRGPRRELKDGIVYLASRTGCPIIPVSGVASRDWTVAAGWTELVIPQPFARAWVVFGEPIHVPPGLDREGLDEYTRRVQAAMDAVCEETARLRGRPALGPAVPPATQEDHSRQAA